VTKIKGAFTFVRLAILPALLLAGFTLHLWYWHQIDHDGRTILCPVERKTERIDRRSQDDSWKPVFHVELACDWPAAGAPFASPAFDTNEQEYDRLQRGMPLEVRYLRDVPLPLLVIGISGAHLARETLDVHVLRIANVFGPIAVIIGYILVLSLLGWLMTRYKRRGLYIAFFVLLGIAVIYMLTPTLPVGVSGQTATATATITDMRVFERLLDTSRSQGIEASVPYELLVLEFVPSGRREPVLAGDMIDVNSRPGLAVGQQVAITYETAHPRHANVQNATRMYYWRNVEGAIIEGFFVIGFLVGGTLLWEYIKRRGREAIEQARERARDRAL
jgi:hypothetical protein